MKNDDFEKNFNELNNIVSQLESGKTGLNESIALYEKGMKLSAECMKILSEAKQKIEIIQNENSVDYNFDSE